ncbi:MAG: DUF3794 domain-containing protein [Clostridia bacterium]|nr:DUF3794 domain-containing protein [Clostridia bacterium]
MNFQTEKQTVGVAETVLDTTAEQSLEADLHLPDYCPEISRILRCAVDTSVSGVQTQADQLTAHATAMVRLFYLGENGDAAAYEQSFSVQGRVSLPAGAQVDVVSVQVQTEYANCRALDPRRAEVKAMLRFLFRAQSCKREAYLTGVQGGGMQTMTASFPAADLVGLAEKTFSLSEVAQLPADHAPIARVLHAGACVVPGEIKIINNKALLKGDCEVTVHYLAETGAVESMTHALPISQILELDGLTEDCVLQLRHEVRAAEAVTKADAADDTKLLELTVSVCVIAAAYRETTLQLLTDAYSTQGSVNVRRRTAELLAPDQQFQTSFTNKVVLESIGVAVRRVLAVWCEAPRATASLQDRSCCLSGSYQTGILYEDESGEIGCLQKTVAFDDRIPLKTDAQRICAETDLQILGAACVATGDSRLELRTEISASGMIFAQTLCSCVADLTAQTASQEDPTPAALTIYFSEPGESLWEIARRYRTTVDAIRAENSLDADRITEKTMLLIPASIE